MLTVVHVITALGSGGAERMLFQVASSSLLSGEVRQLVVCLAEDGHYGPELRKAGVELHCLGMRPGRFSVAALWRLVRLLRSKRPDVVMTWLYHADLFGTVAARLAGARRVVWNVRCSDIDFSRYSRATRVVVGMLVRLSPVPWAIATNSHAGRQVHERLGYRPKRWLYLPNGFDTDQWKPDLRARAAVREELGFAEDDIVVGMVARVDPQKDHASFLEAASVAAARNPRMRIILVGRGTETLEIPAALVSITEVLGERRDLPRLMRAMDLLVSSSAYGEGFPNVLGEAMASGVSCIATDVGDSALLLADVGSVVPPRDARALARALEAMIDAGAVVRSNTALLARERIEQEFSVERCLARYAEVLGAACADGGRDPRAKPDEVAAN